MGTSLLDFLVFNVHFTVHTLAPAYVCMYGICVCICVCVCTGVFFGIPPVSRLLRILFLRMYGCTVCTVWYVCCRKPVRLLGRLGEQEQEQEQEHMDGGLCSK